MPIAASTDPVLALRWLTRARRGVLSTQILLMLLAEAGTELHLHAPSLLAVVAGWALIDVLQSLLLSKLTPPSWTVAAHAAVDLGALTGILLLAGGPHNPLLYAYQVYLALLAMVLPERQAWTAAGFAVLLQACAVFFSVPVPGLAPEQSTFDHLIGHAVSFDLSAVAITWVVSHLSASLREREAAEIEAQRRRSITERLAALGTLAAGVAHELGTPLGAIQLLASEASAGLPAEDPNRETLKVLQEQVVRCGSLLERLRGRDEPSEGDCAPLVERWVAEWRLATPDVRLDLAGQAEGERVLGAEESWRRALWVALDNARKAGAAHVSVFVEDQAEAVEIRVEDDGAGLDEAAAERAGEPFRTGWGGTGLGLFVSRSYATSVGGELSLESLGARGARTRIRMPKVRS